MYSVSRCVVLVTALCSFQQRKEVVCVEESKKKWQRAVQRGAETERRFFAAFRDRAVTLPSWLYGIRKGTPIDDAQGIDAFAITSCGEIPIQIKSSYAGLRKFCSVSRTRYIVVVVIQQTNPQSIVDHVIRFVEPVWRRRRNKK